MIKLNKTGLALLVAGTIGLSGLIGCDSGPKRMGCEKVLKVEPHHATRLIIIYRDKNGKVYRDSFHQSHKFVCGDVEIDPHDYLSLYGGSMPYGEFDPEEYQMYKQLHKGLHKR